MKKRLTVLFVTAAVGAAAYADDVCRSRMAPTAALPCPAVEVLPPPPANPGFEAGTNGWQIPNALWRIESDAGRKGSKCLVYENNDPKLYFFPRHPLALDAGGIYRYGAWVKVDARSGDGKRRIEPKVSLDFADASGKWIGADYARPVGKPDTDGWVRYEGVTRPLASAVVGGNLFGFMPRGGTGRVRFDDFFIYCEEVRHVDAVVSSAYRDTATEGTVSFVATLFVDPAKMPLDTLSAKFSYCNANGVEAEVPAETLDSEHAAVKLDVARFAAGTHPVTFVLRTKAAGRELGRAACSFTRAAVLRRVAFDRFGRTLVDGKPFFPLGMYARDVTPEALAIYTNGTPYNCIMPYRMPSKEMLDVCRDAGLMVICSVKDFVYGVNEDRELFRSREDSFAHIAKMVRAAKNHPATLAWYANDESPPRQIDTLRDLKHMIHELDPDHPVWHVTDSPLKVRPFIGSYDVIGQDPYPIGLSGADADIGRAATDALMTREAMYDTVPMWHVPQAFNWAWQKGHKSEQPRYPTEEELVSMTWQPIAAGVNGLIYYAFHRICMATEGAERDECLRRAAAAAAEVKAKMPILLSEPGPVVLSAPKGMVCRTWRTADGKVTLLAANTTRRALVGTVAFAGGLASQTVELSPLGHKFIEITSTKK